MSFHFDLPGGARVKLLTAGKYCTQDISVAGTGYSDTELQAKYEQGLDQGAANCAATHFIHTLRGTGSGSISFFVPFEPDALCIIGFDPTFNKKPYALGSCVADLRAFGQIAGHAAYDNAAGTIQQAAFTTSSVWNRYSRTQDGMVTLKDLIPSLSVVFDPSYHYTIFAMKYTDRTDAERITDFVSGLTGSGSATLNQAKVTAAFTDEAWAALIAGKPGWTFNWI